MNEPLLISDPLRVLLLFHDKLSNIEAVPLGRGRSGAGGTIRGREALHRFIVSVGIDSIIATTQLRDLPNPAFERVFHVHTAEQIIAAIERRYAAHYEAFSRIMEGQPLSEHHEAALHRFEDLQLGSTVVSAEEGRNRMQAWFAKDSASAAG
jgi:hypothetical protein